MTYDPQKHQRRSIRLKGYDYSQDGLYFITICLKDGLCLFGNVVEGEMILNPAGEMIEKRWLELPESFPQIELDAYQVMPNHFHGILGIRNANLHTERGDQLSGQVAAGDEWATTRVGPTEAGIMVGAFKSITTYKYIQGVKESGWVSFPGKLWQRNFFEHIIRNERTLKAIREYIINNPANWLADQHNPNKPGNETRAGSIKQQRQP